MAGYGRTQALIKPNAGARVSPEVAALLHSTGAAVAVRRAARAGAHASAPTSTGCNRERHGASDGSGDRARGRFSRTQGERQLDEGSKRGRVSLCLC